MVNTKKKECDINIEDGKELYSIKWYRSVLVSLYSEGTELCTQYRGICLVPVCTCCWYKQSKVFSVKSRQFFLNESVLHQEVQVRTQSVQKIAFLRSILYAGSV